jgi:hypothetical protein
MNISKKQWSRPHILGLGKSKTASGFVPGSEGHVIVNPHSNSTHDGYSSWNNSPATTTMTEFS